MSRISALRRGRTFFSPTELFWNHFLQNTKKLGIVIITTAVMAFCFFSSNKSRIRCRLLSVAALSESIAKYNKEALIRWETEQRLGTFRRAQLDFKRDGLLEFWKSLVKNFYFLQWYKRLWDRHRVSLFPKTFTSLRKYISNINEGR